MGKVIIHVTMSLDGFIAGPHDEMDWVFRYGSDKMVEEVIKEIGAVVLGKRTFDISLEKNQLPYNSMVKVPQFVITKKAQEPRTIGGLSFTFVTDGVESAVSQAKLAAGDENVALLGAALISNVSKPDLSMRLSFTLRRYSLARAYGCLITWEVNGLNLKEPK